MIFQNPAVGKGTAIFTGTVIQFISRPAFACGYTFALGCSSKFESDYGQPIYIIKRGVIERLLIVRLIRGLPDKKLLICANLLSSQEIHWKKTDIYLTI